MLVVVLSCSSTTGHSRGGFIQLQQIFSKSFLATDLWYLPTLPTYNQEDACHISCIVLQKMGKRRITIFHPPLAYLRYYGFVGDLRQCIQTAAKEEICLSIDVALQCQSRGKTILPDVVTISMETNKFSCEVC